jgi:CheY-like chemotaxis protein
METYNTKNIYNKLTEPTNKKNMNILIVDDDIMGAECLKEILELHNHTVNIIDDAIRCITLCQNNKYDIVFMDYHMEGLDGAQITMLLKDQKIGKTIIFAYTGDNSNAAIKQFKETGMNGAIIKPIDMNSFEILLNYLEAHYFLYFNNQNTSLIAKKSNKSILIF